MSFSPEVEARIRDGIRKMQEQSRMVAKPDSARYLWNNSPAQNTPLHPSSQEMSTNPSTPQKAMLELSFNQETDRIKAEIQAMLERVSERDKLVAKAMAGSAKLQQLAAEVRADIAAIGQDAIELTQTQISEVLQSTVVVVAPVPQPEATIPSESKVDVVAQAPEPIISQAEPQEPELITSQAEPVPVEALATDIPATPPENVTLAATEGEPIMKRIERCPYTGIPFYDDDVDLDLPTREAPDFDLAREVAARKQEKSVEEVTQFEIKVNHGDLDNPDWRREIFIDVSAEPVPQTENHIHRAATTEVLETETQTEQESRTAAPASEDLVSEAEIDKVHTSVKKSIAEQPEIEARIKYCFQPEPCFIPSLLVFADSEEKLSELNSDINKHLGKNFPEEKNTENPREDYKFSLVLSYIYTEEILQYFGTRNDVEELDVNTPDNVTEVKSENLINLAEQIGIDTSKPSSVEDKDTATPQLIQISDRMLYISSEGDVLDYCCIGGANEIGLIAWGKWFSLSSDIATNFEVRESKQIQKYKFELRIWGMSLAQLKVMKAEGMLTQPPRPKTKASKELGAKLLAAKG